MQQRSDEWFAARLGKVTASRVVDVMAKKTTGAYRNYMVDLLCERLAGTNREMYVNEAMQRGIDLEPVARIMYEQDNLCLVEECGLIDHPEIYGFSASPDGLVGDDGLIEIKCPNTSTHIDFLMTQNPAEKYMWQMAAQMACTNRDWVDFVSFDDRLPGHMALRQVRIHRDLDRERRMLDTVKDFLSELNDLMKLAEVGL